MARYPFSTTGTGQEARVEKKIRQYAKIAIFANMQLSPLYH